jgi:hypothetical protein
MIDKLRDEIIESQKARNDLLKWKLILVAALGAAGLGIGPGASPGASPNLALLALIPFVCLYVDALCFHDEIRMLVIAGFLRKQDKDVLAREFEDHCTKFRRHFYLESWVLLWTTVALSALIFIVGCSARMAVLLLAGAAGVVAGALFYRFFSSRRNELDRSWQAAEKRFGDPSTSSG